VSLKWLRAIWALAAFVPLALALILVVTDQFGVVFLLAAVYLLPASWVTRQRHSAGSRRPSFRVSFEGRGHDGDHYLFIEERETNDVFVYFQHNF
jgi:hypothetical protein